MLPFVVGFQNMKGPLPLGSWSPSGFKLSMSFEAQTFGAMTQRKRCKQPQFTSIFASWGTLPGTMKPERFWSPKKRQKHTFNI